MSSSPASSSPAGTPARRRTCVVTGTIPAGPQGRGARHRAGRAGAPLQPDHRLRHARRSAPASTCTCTTWRWATSQRDYAFWRSNEKTEFAAAAGHVHGHRARRRPRRHAQLHRHPDQRELLGDRGAHDRRPLSRQSPRQRLSQRRRRRRAHAQHRLRHGYRRRGHGHPARARWRATRAIPTSSACWSSAWAARRTRSTPALDAEPQARATALHAFTIQDKGGTRKTVREGHRAHQGDAARSEPGEARAGAARRTSRSACSAAARTATRASAPIRRWARRWTCWCATAAPRSFPRRPRSTAPSTC